MTPTSEITSSTAVPVPDSVQAVPAAAETVLREMFDVHRATTAQISPVVATLVDQLAAFTLNGGKRVRPTFAWSGYRCAGGRTDEAIARQALTVCTALELIQACALIHDDIIDRSDTRRGRPTVHRALERLQSWLAEPSAATLVVVTHGAVALPGGDVTDLAGEDWRIDSKSALAGLPGLHGELLDIVRSVGTPEDF